MSRGCSVDGCAQRHNAQGYCRVHYNQARRAGVISRLTPEDRFWAKVEKGDGCWLWVGTCSPAGYGQFGVDGKLQAAHRWLWAQRHGVIPAGIVLCHTCDVRNCVRPEHLFRGTQADNMRDMVDKGRSHKFDRTHCARDHELTPENTYVGNRNGYATRVCRTCQNEAQRERRAS